MAIQQTIMVGGEAYVLLPREEYEKLTALARAADLPPLPNANADGTYPAVEYARASLARKIIRDRAAAGLTQKELATLAGISVEHLCRLETGKHTPSIPTIDKIDRALKQLIEKRESKPTSKRKAKKGK